MTNTPEVIAALDAVIACEKDATPGEFFTAGPPWHSQWAGVLAGTPDPHAATVVADCSLDALLDDGDERAPADPEANARFIAASANLSRHAPALKAMVEENDRLRSVVCMIGESIDDALGGDDGPDVSTLVQASAIARTALKDPRHD